eukprot:Skav226616  [mRNA]  locus=scaffold2041:249049:250893:- [translate_table: standard]
MPFGALNCHFAQALCLGIGDYEGQERLPRAAEDAEKMKAAFEGLGCCDARAETCKLTKQKTNVLVSDFVLRAQQEMEAEAGSKEKPLLVAFYVASHGIHGKDLPLIVPADRKCSETEELINLDDLLFQKLAQIALPRRNRRKCCVWIIMDTCRSCQSPTSDPNAGSWDSNTWGTKLSPEFLILFACDPGGWASDSNSLSSALVRSLQQDGISIRDACEQAIDVVVNRAPLPRQRPWMNQRAGTIFSEIRRASAVQDMNALIQWMIAHFLRFAIRFALLVCLVFISATLISFSQIRRATQWIAGFLRFTIGLALQQWKIAHFVGFTIGLVVLTICFVFVPAMNPGPEHVGPCSVAIFLHIFKVLCAVAISRKSWIRVLRLNSDGATLLDWCVVLTSSANVLTSYPSIMFYLQALFLAGGGKPPLVWFLLGDPAHIAWIIPYSYGVFNFAFTTASVLILLSIHAEIPRRSLWNCGGSDFTQVFLGTVLIGYVLISMSIFAGLEAPRDGKQDMRFYAFHVFTGATLALVGFAVSRRGTEDVAKKSSHHVCVSLCWMFVVLVGLLCGEELQKTLRLLRIVRLCNLWKIHLMVWFSNRSILGGLPQWEAHPPRLVPIHQ